MTASEKPVINATYDSRMETVESILSMIKDRLAEHAEHGTKPTWPAVGDLGFVIDKLAEINDFLAR